MRLAAVLIAIRLVGVCGAQPTTAPASQPAGPQPLHGGLLTYVAPQELTFLGKRDDDRSAGFSLGDNEALITLLVTPQQHPVPDDIAPKLAQLIGKTIREEASLGQLDIIMQPKVEKDGRFLLRVHDKFNTLDRFGDRVQLYRALGKNLVLVTATAFTEDAEEATRVHQLGEQLLLSVKVNRETSQKTWPKAARAPTTRPTTFAAAGIRVTAPPGWDATATDNPSGVIVTYRDPEDQTNLITISTRKLPPEARRDPKIRDLLVDEIVSAEKQSFKIEGAEITGQTRDISDRRFLRKARTDYTHEDRRFSVISRQVRAGDVIVSVTMVALDSSVDTIDALADKVALDLRPIGSSGLR